MFGFTSILVWPGCMLVHSILTCRVAQIPRVAGAFLLAGARAGEDEEPSFGTFALWWPVTDANGACGARRSGSRAPPFSTPKTRWRASGA